jgi:hypothetical protein
MVLFLSYSLNKIIFLFQYIQVFFFKYKFLGQTLTICLTMFSPILLLFTKRLTHGFPTDIKLVETIVVQDIKNKRIKCA